MAKKLTTVDVAFGVPRHITGPSSEGLKEELVGMLDCADKQLTQHSASSVPVEDISSDVSSGVGASSADLKGLAALEMEIAKVKKNSIAALEMGTVELIDGFFKDARGKWATTWPPIDGMSEEAARENITEMMKSRVTEMAAELGVSGEHLERMHEIVAEQSKHSMEKWKGFVKICTSGLRDKKQHDEEMDNGRAKRIRLKGVTQVSLQPAKLVQFFYA